MPSLFAPRGSHNLLVLYMSSAAAEFVGEMPEEMVEAAKQGSRAKNFCRCVCVQAWKCVVVDAENGLALRVE